MQVVPGMIGQWTHTNGVLETSNYSTRERFKVVEIRDSYRDDAYRTFVCRTLSTGALLHLSEDPRYTYNWETLNPIKPIRIKHSFLKKNLKYQVVEEA